MYPPIATYLNHFSENTKKSVKKAFLKVENDIRQHIPVELSTQLRQALNAQWDCVFNHEFDKALIKDIPNMRSLQIANANLPR